MEEEIITKGQQDQVQKLKKPFYKKWWFGPWFGSFVFIFLITFFVAIIGINKTNKELDELFFQLENQNIKISDDVNLSKPITNSTTEEWQILKSWDGNGIKNTELFTITGNQWRVNWEYKGFHGHGSGMLEIYVFKPNGDLEGVAAGIFEVGSDSSYFYKKGTFYLMINSPGTWIVEIEELK